MPWSPFRPGRSLRRRGRVSIQSHFGSFLLVFPGFIGVLDRLFDDPLEQPIASPPRRRVAAASNRQTAPPRRTAALRTLQPFAEDSRDVTATYRQAFPHTKARAHHTVIHVTGAEVSLCL
jgi:hypothetical protein